MNQFEALVYKNIHQPKTGEGTHIHTEAEPKAVFFKIIFSHIHCKS